MSEDQGESWACVTHTLPPNLLNPFNFNPLHRDLNRGDQRLLWNAILNWEAILTRRAAAD